MSDLVSFLTARLDEWAILVLADEVDATERALDEEVGRVVPPGEITVGEEIRRALAAVYSDQPGCDPAWSPR
jgi:hypothetical protein